EKFWFPGIDRQAERLISAWIPCQASTVYNKHQLLQMSELTEGPYQNVSVDFCGLFPSGDYLLGVLDEYSRFPFVEITPSTSAHLVIPLDKIFSTAGIPKIMKSYNGPPIFSQELANFTPHFGIHHCKMALLASSQVEVERFMRTLKKAASTATVEGKSWKQELHKFLRNYRATPHETTGTSLAELLFGRPINIKLPALQSPVINDTLRCTDGSKKEKMKQYSDNKKKASHSELNVGDAVLNCERKTGKLMTPFNPKSYTVIKTKGIMIIVQRGRHVATRHISLLKSRKQCTSIPITNSTDDETEDSNDVSRPLEPGMTRSFLNVLCK
ncbi:hypothetical protein M9458_048499, partial [Cirrhinus mrigala]